MPSLLEEKITLITRTVKHITIFKFKNIKHMKYYNIFTKMTQYLIP